jgi:hypothetical protein
MPRPEISAIRFRPPVAIARLGDSPSPVEAFTWAEDPRIFGAGKTVVVPRVSFEVLADGSIEPYMPWGIRFRDGRAIRPVCPFFELEAKVSGYRKREQFGPLTSRLLNEAGIKPAQLSFRIVAANRKAERRTGDPACRFEARALVRADDYTRHDLRAWSHASTGNLLVLPDRPILLGAVQVIRPSKLRSHLGVSLDTIRFRFTPGRGEVYGPLSTTSSETEASRHRHVIVRPENRILNPSASWVRYNFNNPSYPPPFPPDTYDGESDIDSDGGSWGIVDDTCDVLIVATLAAVTTTVSANARVFVGPPDYAPDRRPFCSLADELADRDPESLRKAMWNASPGEWHDSVADLFRRVAETTSMINLERQRSRQLEINAEIVKASKIKNESGFPEINDKSMTAEDKILGVKLLSDAAVEQTLSPAGENAQDVPVLPRAEYAKTRHDELSEPDVLLPFLLENPDRIRQLMRPPFARASELETKDEKQKPFDLRDPRYPRSYLYDMRMPPYMRDGDFAPLSLTRLQWDLLFRRDVGVSSSQDPVDFTKTAYAELSANQRSRRLKPRKKRLRSSP